MPIKSQTFIRDIPKNRVELIKKIAADNNFKTTPQVVNFLIDNYYKDKNLLEHTIDQNSNLKTEVYNLKSTLAELKTSLESIFNFVKK